MAFFPPFMRGNSWQGADGEDLMSPQDWKKRAHEQAMAMREGGDAFDSSPDRGGCETGGDYNGDYPDSYHDACNESLEQEYYEAEADAGMRHLFKEWSPYLCELSLRSRK